MKAQHGLSPLRRSLLVLVALSAVACATGEVTGAEEDAGSVPSTDRPATVQDGGFTIDLFNPLEEDIGGGSTDTGTTDRDSGMKAADVGSVGVDAGTTDVGSTDAGTRDVGVPDVGTPDVGGCSMGEAACGGGCVDLQHDARNCGSCGHACGEVEACTSGVCTSTCAAPRTLCGTGASTRCVDTQVDAENCGACGTACGMGGACTSGRCATAACMTAASDCNGSAADGCEVIHGTATNTCVMGEDLGAYCGDTSCAFLCGGTRLRTVATRTGTRSRWFRARLTECSTCPASLDAHVTLNVPPGVDYDLFVYRPCGTLVGSSRSTGVIDQVSISQSEIPTLNDSFDFVIEVRWYGGASCMPWTLTLEARADNGTNC